MKEFEKPLTAAQENYYLERLHLGDKEAKKVLIERNLRLVAHMVKKYSYNENEMEDMISIGTIGLIKAIETFDPNKGNRLATYAARCIDNELLMRLRADKKRMYEVSLCEPMGTDKEGNEICIQDVTSSEEVDVVGRLQLKQDIQTLRRQFGKLTSREKQILIYRYGLEGVKPLTQRELAGFLGISRSYVSRIEKRAIEKLKEGFDNT